jgi:hypothetical protein
MNAWAASLPRSQLDALIELREEADIRIAEHGGRVWLRGPDWNATVDRLLRGIPDARRFRLFDDGRLVPANSTLATDRLPELEWSPLRSALSLRLDLAERRPLGNATIERVELRLVRERSEVGGVGGVGGRSDVVGVGGVGGPDALIASANLVLTTVADWCAFVEASPRAMWEGAAFAADASGRCVVLAARGVGVRGERWRERDGIAAPMGWRWEPAVAAGLLRRCLFLADGDVALWFPENHIERIEAASFVRASRSAARETRMRWLAATAPTRGEG